MIDQDCVVAGAACSGALADCAAPLPAAFSIGTRITRLQNLHVTSFPRESAATASSCRHPSDAQRR